MALLHDGWRPGCRCYFCRRDPSQWMEVRTVCPHCQREEFIKVPTQGFLAWQARTVNIQVALAEVHAIQREQLMTGLCGPCWEDLFAEDEPEQSA